MANSAVQDLSELYLRFAAKIGVITEAEWKREQSNYVGKETTAIGKALVEKGVLHPNNFKLLESMFARQLSRNTQAVQALPGASKTPTETMIKVPEEHKEAIDIQKGDTTKLKGSPVSSSRYKIVRPLTTSRCSELFVAEDLELHREVILKRLLPQHQKAPGFRIRFNRTAETTSGLEHPCIPPIYNHGLDPEGRPFYTTRYLPGETLTESVGRLFAGDPADLPRSIETRNRVEGLRKHVQRLLQVCSAVSYAHARGVMHCGLTPDRILLGKFSETLVVGWGRSELIYGRKAKPAAGELKTPEAKEKASKNQSRRETPTPYTSPEQVVSTDAATGGILSDVYSLGAILHFVAIGKAPFDAQPEDLPTAVQLGRSSSAIAEVEAVSPTIAGICSKAMSLDPTLRYSSVREFASRLEEWLDARSARAVADTTAAAVSTRGPRTKPRLQVSTAVTACVICALAGIWFGRSVAASPKSETNATPAPEPIATPEPKYGAPDFSPYFQLVIAGAVQAHDAAVNWSAAIEKRKAERTKLKEAHRAARDARFVEALKLTQDSAGGTIAVDRAEWLGATGRHAEAASEFERLAAVKSDDDFRILVGLAEQRLALEQPTAKELDRAKKLLETTKANRTLEARLRSVDGAALLKAKKPKEAAAALKTATELWSGTASAADASALDLLGAANTWDSLRLLHAGDQKTEMAIQAADRTLALLNRIPAKDLVNERIADINSERGLLLVQLGRLADAENAFSRVVEASATVSANARYLRSACRIELKNFAGARHDAEMLAKSKEPTSKYLAARIFARLSAVKDASPADGNRAMTLLKDLAAGDFFTGDRTDLPKTDPDLESVRQRADFKASVSPPRDATAKSNPSASAP